jgi:hypothetical protein
MANGLRPFLLLTTLTFGKLVSKPAANRYKEKKRLKEMAGPFAANANQATYLRGFGAIIDPQL